MPDDDHRQESRRRPGTAGAGPRYLGKTRVKPTTATVVFMTEKGSRGGVTICCAVTVMVLRQAPLRVSQVAVAASMAFNGAVHALERMLSGAPDRRRALSRRPKKYYVARRALETSS